MASIKFRTRKGINEETIYLRFKPSGYKDYEISTGIKVPKGKFSNKLQRINQSDKVDSDFLNQKLRDLKIFIRQKYDTDNLDGKLINNNWLKVNIKNLLNQKVIDSSLNDKIYLSSYVESFIKKAESRHKTHRNLKKRTIDYYKTFLNKIKYFQEYKGQNIRLSEITVHMNQEFIAYLRDIEYLADNTIGKFVKQLKQVCKEAEMDGLNVSSDYKSTLFKAPSSKTYDIYLNEDEIDKIFRYNFENEKLDNARDWLIISVWTGLRVSDLLRLDRTYINENNFIDLTTIKTNTPLQIHINPYVEYILKKREGEFPKKISDQKYNDYIKIVCKEVGINELTNGSRKVLFEGKVDKEGRRIFRNKVDKYPKYQLVSSHIGRRSFATNMYGQMPTLHIMKITGHTTEKQFLKYIKKASNEYAAEFRRYWENQNIELD